MRLTPLQQQILETLEATDYNIHATAERIGVSVTYAQRVAEEYPKQLLPPTQPQSPPPSAGMSGSSPQGDQAALAAPPAQSDTLLETLSKVIPPNVAGVTDLRDASIEYLRDHLDDGSITIGSVRMLLKDLLSYETRMQAIARPVSNTFVDARQQTVNMTNLVNLLEGLPEDRLRAIAEGEIVDG